MKKYILLFLLISIGLNVIAQEINIIPQPVSIKLTSKQLPFRLDSNTALYTNTDENYSINFLDQYLDKYYNLKLNRAKGLDSKRTNSINIHIDNKLKKKNEYAIVVNQNAITITASTDTGAFYGMQTLIQLLPTKPTN